MSTQTVDTVEITRAISRYPTLEMARAAAKDDVHHTRETRDQAHLAWLQHSLAEIRAATTWRKFERLELFKRICSGTETSAAYAEQLEVIMRQDVESIKTPGDILRVQTEWAARKTYSNKMQEELGEKAKQVISAWRPDHHRGASESWR